VPGTDYYVSRKTGGSFGYVLNVNGTTPTYGSAEADYDTDVLTGFMRDWIATAPEPWVIYYAPGVHEDSEGDVNPAPRHAGLYPGLEDAADADPGAELQQQLGRAADVGAAPAPQP
jgi:hypothetical protein